MNPTEEIRTDAPFPTAAWNEKRVLVTGGAGVIGTEMIALLDAAGAHVLCADLKPRPIDFPERFAYIEGDANDLTSEPLATFDPEICVHLAATFERSTETEEFWDENFHHNIRLSHHLMTLLRRASSSRRAI